MFILYEEIWRYKVTKSKKCEKNKSNTAIASIEDS